MRSISTFVRWPAAGSPAEALEEVWRPHGFPRLFRLVDAAQVVLTLHPSNGNQFAGLLTVGALLRANLIHQGFPPFDGSAFASSVASNPVSFGMIISPTVTSEPEGSLPATWARKASLAVKS